MKTYEKGISLSIWTLSWPIFIEVFLQILVGNIDQLMMSHYSPQAVAAVANANQIFNISGDEYLTMSEFTEICGKVMAKKAVIKYINTEEKKIKARDWFPFREVNLFGDISKLENTGFRNMYSLVQGLEKTYKYNDENDLIDKPVLNKLETEN